MMRKRGLTRNLRVTPSTGNVFRDLGFSEEEAAHLLVRSDLMIQVQKLIAARRLTQQQVAKVLRVTQPRVSDLLRGRIDLFSTDTLLDMLGRLGVRVRFVLKPLRGSLKVA
jgi:predicted XRE-type DNA-binding protein